MLRGQRIVKMALAQKARVVRKPEPEPDPDTDISVSGTDSEYFPDSDKNSTSSSVYNSEDNTTKLQENCERSLGISTNEDVHFNNQAKIHESFKKSKAKRIKRKHYCLYCCQDVSNFSRHLERNHSEELDVQKFMNLAKNSKQRKKIVDKIRREGDFCTSKIVPVMSLPSSSSDNYICCIFCRGYYKSTSLRRHSKKCFFNPDPSARVNAQIAGQNLMVGPFGPNDPLRVSGLLAMMRADDISMVAKKDKIICEVARRYIKSHREKHQLVVAKRYMRRLARLLICLRKIRNNLSLNLLDILNPHYFRSLITATKIIAEYDEKQRLFKSPSLALQLGTLLKHAINSAVSFETQKENCCKEKIDKLKTLKTLIDTDWASEVSSEAAQNLAINKFNKPSLIPIAEDIKKFDKYLKGLIRKAKVSLAENSENLRAYRDLLDGIFCSLMIFNKRRVGELQRMTVQCFQKNYDAIPSREFEKALTNSEKIVYQSVKRIVIRGKRGRGVPVLFDKRVVQAVEYLLSVRHNFDLAHNEFLFGLPGTNNPISGYVVMRKHAQLALCDKQRALLLMSTKLRKHLATITQIFNMEKLELEQLACFMGHTEKTHAQFYRLPDDVYQTAKISKLLMLSKEGAIERFKGKSLEEIDVGEYIEENESNSDDNNDDEEIPMLNEALGQCESSNGNTSNSEKETEPSAIRTKTTNCKNRKRTLIPWTEEQKKVTEKCFSNHIKKKIPQKKDEVMKLKEKYPKLFSNKPYPTIKVYVCNKYRNK